MLWYYILASIVCRRIIIRSRFHDIKEWKSIITKVIGLLMLGWGLVEQNRTCLNDEIRETKLYGLISAVIVDYVLLMTEAI